MTVRDPPQHEERRLHLAAVEQLEQPVGIGADPALEAFPEVTGNDAVEDADVEVVFHVDRHRIHDGSWIENDVHTSGAATEEDRLDCREHDEQVEWNRQVLDIEQVVLQLLERILDADDP